MPGKNRKVQTRLLVREGAPHQQTRNCKKKLKRDWGNLVAGPKWVLETKTDWPTDCRSQYNFDFDIYFRVYANDYADKIVSRFLAF
jgi:hypothetical protein